MTILQQNNIEFNSNREKKNTIIVAALFCCGKTSLSKSNSKYSIIDLDEEIEPKPKDGKYTRKIGSLLNIDSLIMTKIKESIGYYDFIFIAVKHFLLSLLAKNNIPYILVFPENTRTCYKEWERRNIERNTEWLWNACKPQWNYILYKLNKDKNAKKKYVLKENEYLSDIIDKIYLEQNT